VTTPHNIVFLARWPSPGNAGLEVPAQLRWNGFDDGQKPSKIIVADEDGSNRLAFV
jgi:hypothetical protein